eukprot:scaffold292522_cov19-Tisochrysis_lutea.AAC.1
MGPPSNSSISGSKRQSKGCLRGATWGSLCTRSGWRCRKKGATLEVSRALDVGLLLSTLNYTLERRDRIDVSIGRRHAWKGVSMCARRTWMDAFLCRRHAWVPVFYADGVPGC